MPWYGVRSRIGKPARYDAAKSSSSSRVFSMAKNVSRYVDQRMRSVVCSK